MNGERDHRGDPQDEVARLRAELDEMRHSEELFRSFFDEAVIGKSITAPDGRLLRVNRAFCDMLGYTVDEMQSLDFAAVTHPEDRAEGRECVRSLSVVSPGCSGNSSSWERLREAAAAEPVATSEGPLEVTVSIGTAECRGDIASDRLIAADDEALYRAKEGGRNRVEHGRMGGPARGCSGAPLEAGGRRRRVTWSSPTSWPARYGVV